MNGFRKTVLVTDGDIRKTLAVVRGLGKDFKIIVVHSSRLPIAGLSKYCDKKIKVKYDERYHLSILSILEQERPNFLVCTQEETLIRLNLIRDNIKATGVILTFPNAEILNGALDKSITIKYASEVGIPVPKTFNFRNLEELLEVESEFEYPIVIKPKRSIFLKDGKIIKTFGPSYASKREELMDVLMNSNLDVVDLLFQEYIKGNGIGGFFLCNDKSEIIMSFAHQRLLDVNPTGSGSSFRKSEDLNETVLKYSSQLLKRMKWKGVAMVEFRKSELGECFLMEVNGRFWGSLALALESGLNFPIALVRSVEENKYPAEYVRGKPVRLIWEMGMFLRFIRIMKGKPKGYPGHFPSRFDGVKELFQFFNFKNRYEVFKWSDPKPIISEVVAGFKKI
uniref:carboxylate--amine ligase n=1 Tax=Roseivirga sp. TaxID=1964215 RepID=UPI00404716F5